MLKVPRFVTEFANYQMSAIDRLDLDPSVKLKLQRRIDRLCHAAHYGEALIGDTMYAMSIVTTTDYIESVKANED